ncbi:MAG: UDP-N-acetylmuramoyl-L-alanyl-D-glutamate--2,6-diaminopimelate ligase [Terriglobales bacterium]|jgi:UDP-N-acetylmuramoyl-L-alanyl-D-glutamate--2,6-diaminopimelate ligase|nr:UDP-N-acetylmuramoyl-L-alanyl-D-glutamate--2,6-diaminopimelate ligase [Terriglobales bacterium]
MTFLQLLDGAEVLFQRGNPEISGLQYDSRKVKPGDTFVAMRGESSDGNGFIDRAIAAGAVAVVTDSATEKPRQNSAWAQVPHGRRALARLSANFYGHPADKLRITGITGTNGKSTTAFLLESILKAAKRQTALIGTIEYHVAGNVLPAPHTTPESLELNSIFANALSRGATEVVMEASSHALAQQRVYGIPFDCAVFTNLTRDHLDYHHTMDEYFAAKQILFEGCGTGSPRVAVINIDDSYGQKLIEASKHARSAVVTYGFAEGDFHADNVDVSLRGTRFDLVTPEETTPVFSPLIGKVNVYNIVAASAAAHARSANPAAISEGIASLSRVPGRFEPVDCGQPFTVVVDYAHTDDALRNLTSLAREFVEAEKGRVITVFGCGGDRDRSKRPLMGEAVARNSDAIMLTSDNPRSEDPLAIMNDAVVGLQRRGANYKMEPDRQHAIVMAIHEARPGDIVLIAGKGHEKIQVTREGSLPFDDVKVARESLQELGYIRETAKAIPNNP